MASYDMQMEHCAYNDHASAFNNETLNMFPAGWIAKLLGVDNLVLFDGE